MDYDKLRNMTYLKNLSDANEVYKFLSYDSFSKKKTFDEHLSSFVEACEDYIKQKGEKSLVRRGRDYLGSSTSFGEAMMEGMVQNSRYPNEIRDQQDRKCYVLKNNRNGMYKIGYSKYPFIREATLQSEDPDLTMIKVFKSNHESDLHKRYKDQRVRGEWFKLTKVQVKYICTHYK